jgi:hypothetical protein
MDKYLANKHTLRRRCRLPPVVSLSPLFSSSQPPLHRLVVGRDIRRFIGDVVQMINQQNPDYRGGPSTPTTVKAATEFVSVAAQHFCP